jgi:hypothetical protein
MDYRYGILFPFQTRKEMVLPVGHPRLPLEVRDVDSRVPRVAPASSRAPPSTQQRAERFRAEAGMGPDFGILNQSCTRRSP